jgi:hypothetical protein
MSLAKFTAEGLVDTSFGGGDGFTLDNVTSFAPGSPFGSSDETYDLIVEPSGNVVALATAFLSNGFFQVLARYTPTGTLSTLSPESYQPDPASRQGRRMPSSFVRQPDGKFVVQGVARFNADFSRDNTFNDENFGVDGDFRDDEAFFVNNPALPLPFGRVALAANGRIVAASVGQNIVAAFVAVDGNTIAQAPALPLGKRESERVVDGTDVVLRKVTVAAGQTLAFDVDRETHSGLRSYLRLFNGSGREIAVNNNGAAPGESPSSDSYLQYTFPAAGTYYVGISGAGNRHYNSVTGAGDVSTSWGGYFLTVAVLNPEANGRLATATPLALGSTTYATIASVSDVDLYKITVTAAGQRVAFNVNLAGGSLNGYLRLFDAAGVELARNDNGAAPGEAGTLAPYLAHAFAAAGTYYVGLSGYANTRYHPVSGLNAAPGSVGVYQLVVSVL